MNGLRILLISSVLPRDTIGGEVLLYRHFSQFPGLSLAIGLSIPPDPNATDDFQEFQAQDIIEIQASPILTRLKRTRLSKWIHALIQCFHTFHDTQKIRYYIKQNKPDLILTVAHYELCWLAQEISQEFNIPLVTFFHDWWPDMAYVHSFARQILTRRFKRLYQQSQLAFCVDEEILQALGTHPNAQILYPIPNQLVKEESPVNVDEENTGVRRQNLGEVSVQDQTWLQAPDLSHPDKEKFQKFQASGFIREANPKSKNQNPKSNVFRPDLKPSKSLDATLKPILNFEFGIQNSSVEKHTLTVIYAGTLSGIYGPMMQNLCALVQNVTEFRLKLFGPPLDWPDVLVQQVKAHEIYGGFISRDSLLHELRMANALLVAMSFNPRDQMRMQTSFPSKILEYCQFGKPIIIWGPDYSSAVHWGRKHQSALVVTSPLAQDLVNAIAQLATQPQEQERLGNKALEMARGMFNPEKIQQQFVNSLYQIVASKNV